MIPRFQQHSLRGAVCLLVALWAALPGPAWSQRRSAADLKDLSIEELMEIDVTSVSRRSERMNAAAAAITVITSEDLRRSGVTSLPEALRLVNALQVGRQSQRAWAISARGFNITTANKLLVLIDGRSVYTPLFSGVFWDVQDTLLEDVERIEVIRGPGAALWGANAVNGVINIITKRASETQGGLLVAGAGNEERGFGGLRYGGELGDSGHYRAYGKYLNRDDLVFVTGGEAGDPMSMGQGGFRADWRLSESDAFTLQGDAYSGRIGEAIRDDTDVEGGNLSGRWSREISERSGLEVQAYWDRTHRHIPGLFEERLDTLDLHFQQRLAAGARHDVLWGAGYRYYRDRVENSPTVAFLPERKSFDLLTLFAQDEISFLDDRLNVTAGARVEHNDSTGLEVQPSIRAAWTPDGRSTLWGAVSRAVRTPTRIDEDVLFFSPTGEVTIRGSRDFDSEELIAHELGYRIQPNPELLFDVAAFYNIYERLRSQEPPPGGGIPVTLANKLEADVYGVELRMNSQPVPGWRLQLTYAWLEKDLRLAPGSRDPLGGLTEGNDPSHRAMLRSLIDLPQDVELDLWLRYVDELPFPPVEAYTELDLRVGWKALDWLHLSLVGQNLLHERHVEFGPDTPLREAVERSYYGKVTWRF